MDNVTSRIIESSKNDLSVNSSFKTSTLLIGTALVAITALALAFAEIKIGLLTICAMFIISNPLLCGLVLLTLIVVGIALTIYLNRGAASKNQLDLPSDSTTTANEDVVNLELSGTETIDHTPSLLASADFEFINEQIKQYSSFYSASYPDGSKRAVHGVAHATRAALLSMIILEMYQLQGPANQLSADPKYVPLAAFLHDSAREAEGVDHWDRQSGERCKAKMLELGLEDDIATILGHSIEHKDATSPTLLEQKVVHDADCGEIIRCRIPGTFRRGELWIVKDQFPKEMIDSFVNGIHQLVYLTQIPAIKTYLEASPDPFRCLLQIIRFSKCYPLKSRHAKCVNEAVLALGNSDSLLSPAIKQTIEQSMLIANAQAKSAISKLAK